MFTMERWWYQGGNPVATIPVLKECYEDPVSLGQPRSMKVTL